MTTQQSVGAPFGIKGFPTIKFFGYNKKKPSDYNGQRTADALGDESFKQLRKLTKDKASGGKSSGGSSGGNKKSGGGGNKVVTLTDQNFRGKVLDDIGYAENNETIASEFEVAEEEIKKVKEMFNLEAANADLKKRQDLLKKSTDTINGLFDSINANMATMSITIPEDKKKTLTKEIAAVKDKLEVNGRFASTVKKI